MVFIEHRKRVHPKTVMASMPVPKSVFDEHSFLVLKLHHFFTVLVIPFGLELLVRLLYFQVRHYLTLVQMY